jgi:hypothetical protein
MKVKNALYGGLGNHRLFCNASKFSKTVLKGFSNGKNTQKVYALNDA